MRVDKLAVLATVFAVFYLVLKEKGAPARHTVMLAPAAVYHPPVRVYHPPSHRKIPVIFRSSMTSLPILHRRFPHPIPRPPVKAYHPPAKRRFFR